MIIIIIAVFLIELVGIIVLGVLVQKAYGQKLMLEEKLRDITDTCIDVLADLARAKEDVILWQKNINKAGNKEFENQNLKEEVGDLKEENEILTKKLDKINTFGRNDILDLE